MYLLMCLSTPWLQGVANRDLKLENLLLCSNDADALRPLLKIGDFGGWAWAAAALHSACTAPPARPRLHLPCCAGATRAAGACLPTHPPTCCCPPAGYSSRGRADRRVELQHLRGTGGPARGRVASRAARRPLPARVRLTLAAHAAPPPDPPPARPQKADVWSIGVILYTMLVGGFPWTPGDRDCVLNITQAKVGGRAGGRAQAVGARGAHRGCFAAARTRPPGAWCCICCSWRSCSAVLCAPPLPALCPQAPPSAPQPSAAHHAGPPLLPPLSPSRQYTIPQSITISQPCLELLSRILDPDPDLR